MIGKYILSLLICLLIYTSSQAQITDSLDIHQEDFESKLPKYNTWLQSSGLGQVLTTREIAVESDELSVYLQFTYIDSDSASVAWCLLKERYEAKANHTLEEALFFRMVHTMQVDPAKANVQIYDDYDVMKTPCLFVGMQFIDKEVKVTKTTCRADADLSIRLDDLENPQIGISEDFKIEEEGNKFIGNVKIPFKLESKTVLKFIEHYASTKYKTIDKDNFEILSLPNDDFLEFEVKHLRKQVFSDAEESWLCYIWNALFDNSCDDRPREWLKFKIRYLPKNEGFALNTSLTASFATGAGSKPKDSAYQNMEPEFQMQVEAYLRKFHKEIYQTINR